MNARSLVIAAAIATFIPLQAGATISRAMSFDDKVDNAAAIILGKCVRTTSQWDANKKWILTYSTFRIEETMKGQPAQEMTIVTPGGVVGGIHQETVGVPKFSTGGDHVVFVRNTSAGPTVLYFEQGAYEVENVRGERMVKPAVSAAVLVDTQRGIAVAPEEARTLRAFESRVRERIRDRESQRMEILERQKKEQASLVNVLKRNKTLIALALLGAIVATWQLVRRL